MEEQNNVVVQEPKKKSPIGVIILIVILMIGCLVGGYFLNDSGILGGDKKDTEEKNGKDSVVTNYEVTDAKISKLIDNLLVGLDCDKLETYANNSKVEVSDIKSIDIFNIVSLKEFYGKVDSFTLDEFNTAAKKYFAEGYKFNPDEIDYKGTYCLQFNYDSSAKKFNKVQTACGGTCGGPHANYKIVKAIDTDGTLVLTTKVIFGKDSNYYSDYNKTNEIGKYDIYNDPNFDSLFEKGSTYKFTYKLVDGNYAFISSEPAE